MQWSRKRSDPGMGSGYDRLARVYRLMEFLAFGRALERARFRYLERLSGCRRILLLGDGDGRVLARICRLAPQAEIVSVDTSAGMLKRAAHRLTPADRARVSFRQADALTLDEPAGTYDGITTLFFLDLFSPEQVQGLLTRLRPMLTAEVVWLYADFAEPAIGWGRLWARCWLPILFCFFRWQTDLAVRELPDAERLMEAAGFAREAESSWQGGFLRSVVYRRDGR